MKTIGPVLYESLQWELSEDKELGNHVFSLVNEEDKAEVQIRIDSNGDLYEVIEWLNKTAEELEKVYSCSEI